jgi:hypothetical protein
MTLRIGLQIQKPGDPTQMISSQVARTVKNVLPHGLVMKYVHSEAARRRRIAAHNSAHLSVATKQIPYNYSAAINFLTSSGLSESQVIAGSIPEPSLSFCSKVLDEFILTTDGRPLIGLHVGNFVGVSLGHFVDYARQKNEKSVVVSIDPNLICRGIDSPQKHVVAILNHFGLQRNAIICVGYSSSKSISNDGTSFLAENGVEYDPYAGFQSEQSCEDTLSNLCAMSHGKFDFAVVDGNHEGSYLRRETAMVRRLLRPEGILILDDVSDAWTEIKAEYDGLLSNGWRAIAADGRVGVLRSGSA